MHSTVYQVQYVVGHVPLADRQEWSLYAAMTSSLLILYASSTVQIQMLIHMPDWQKQDQRIRTCKYGLLKVPATDDPQPFNDGSAMKSVIERVTGLSKWHW